MVMYTYGTTPDRVIRKALEHECPNGYKMELVGEDREVVTRLVNQGIDSRLEAITKSTFSVGERRLADGRVTQRYLGSTVHNDDMMVLLRRMSEDDSETASSLRMSILFTLNIEEI
jgi:hypothetical protein